MLRSGNHHMGFFVTLDVGRKRVPYHARVAVRLRALAPARQNYFSLDIYRCLADGAAAVVRGIIDACGEFHLGSTRMPAAACASYTRPLSVEFRSNLLKRPAANRKVAVGLAQAGGAGGQRQAGDSENRQEDLLHRSLARPNARAARFSQGSWGKGAPRDRRGFARCQRGRSPILAPMRERCKVLD